MVWTETDGASPEDSQSQHDVEKVYIIKKKVDKKIDTN